MTVVYSYDYYYCYYYYYYYNCNSATTTPTVVVAAAAADDDDAFALQFDFHPLSSFKIKRSGIASSQILYLSPSGWEPRGWVFSLALSLPVPEDGDEISRRNVSFYSAVC